MNVENIQKIINVLRQEENFFSMSQFGRIDDNIKDEVRQGTICDTASCICGWANHIINDGKALTYHQFSNTDAAIEWLGINYITGDELFYGYMEEMGESDINAITRQEAIITLEKLIETGKVDWSHCKGYQTYAYVGDDE